MIIGSRLKELRMKKGYSQKELGELIGVTKVTICGYEKGNRFPNLSKFIALIDCLETEPDYLLGRDVIGVAEDTEKYQINIAKEDILILNELKKRPELYNKLIDDPKRKIELLSRNIKWQIIHEINLFFLSENSYFF